jgi:hypothetical protein
MKMLTREGFDRDNAAYDLLNDRAFKIAFTDIPEMVKARENSTFKYDGLRYLELLDAYSLLRRAALLCLGETYGR